jgi:hypothetical protein
MMITVLKIELKNISLSLVFRIGESDVKPYDDKVTCFQNDQEKFLTSLPPILDTFIMVSSI